jgi:hypothetical protein
VEVSKSTKKTKEYWHGHFYSYDGKHKGSLPKVWISKNNNSTNMEGLNIEKFSPTKAELTNMAEAARLITLPDPLNKEQVEIVKQTRLGLRTARTTITKMGKELREDALAFQKAVISKEKELLAIIEPEEDRLEQLEDDAAQLQEREDRREFLPRRKERLAELKDGIEISDDELLDMAGDVFEGYFNKRMAEKNAAVAAENARKEAEINAEKAKLEREKEIEAEKEKARQGERERIERENKEKAEKEKRDKEETERKEAEAKEKRDRDEKFQAFLKSHNYEEDEEKFWTVQDGDDIRLYRYVATFNQKEKVETKTATN